MGYHIQRLNEYTAEQVQAELLLVILTHEKHKLDTGPERERVEEKIALTETLLDYIDRQLDELKELAREELFDETKAQAAQFWSQRS